LKDIKNKSLENELNWANSRFQNFKGLEPLAFSIYLIFLVYSLKSFTLNQAWFVFQYAPPTPNFPFIVSFFKFLPQDILAFIMIFLSLIIPTISLIFFRSRWARILGALFFLISEAYLASYFRPGVQNRPLLFAILFLALPPKLNEKLNTSDSWSLLTYGGMLLSICLYYFYAGAWKLFNGFVTARIYERDYGSSTLATYLLTHGKESFIGEYFINHPQLCYIGVISIALFQISSLLIFFNRMYFKVWPFLILFFHLISMIVLQVNFFYAGIVSFLVCLLAPIEFRGFGGLFAAIRSYIQARLPTKATKA